MSWSLLIFLGNNPRICLKILHFCTFTKIWFSRSTPRWKFFSSLFIICGKRMNPYQLFYHPPFHAIAIWRTNIKWELQSKFQRNEGRDSEKLNLRMNILCRGGGVESYFLAPLICRVLSKCCEKFWESRSTVCQVALKESGDSVHFFATLCRFPSQQA